ncbi:DUF397 domain-containing protein [Micromonospora sp. NPDC047753]|uniref:DUF397 domain-containing protein n=1 Tax=Micromonospora sp. NPDC047753 TaxID=3154817 RepID=UPI0033CED71D
MDSQWRKSTRSGSNGACVEARHARGLVQIRDSKDLNGPVLSFQQDAWCVFLTALRVRTGIQP